MTFQEALEALGVRDDTLTPAEKDRLDTDGYLFFPDVLTPAQVAAMRLRLEELAALEGERAGIETHQEAGSVRLSDLLNKDTLFDVCLTHPRVLAAVADVIRPEFRYSSLNSRAALPGQGAQHLHADWDEPVAPGEYVVCNSIWLLDDFTPGNGATRVVPGSHRSGRLPQQELADPGASHPREVKLLAPAGSVFVWNGHLWHGGTRNESPRRRLALHSYFCRRDQPQQLDQRRYLRPETAARLGRAARLILDA